MNTFWIECWGDHYPKDVPHLLRVQLQISQQEDETAIATDAESFDGRKRVEVILAKVGETEANSSFSSL